MSENSISVLTTVQPLLVELDQTFYEMHKTLDAISQKIAKLKDVIVDMDNTYQKTLKEDDDYIDSIIAENENLMDEIQELKEEGLQSIEIDFPTYVRLTQDMLRRKFPEQLKKCGSKVEGLINEKFLEDYFQSLLIVTSISNNPSLDNAISKLCDLFTEDCEKKKSKKSKKSPPKAEEKPEVKESNDGTFGQILKDFCDALGNKKDEDEEEVKESAQGSCASKAEQKAPKPPKPHKSSYDFEKLNARLLDFESEMEESRKRIEKILRGL